MADIGCGTGVQTLYIAQNLSAKVLAVYIIPQFLEKHKKHGLAEKVV